MSSPRATMAASADGGGAANQRPTGQNNLGLPWATLRCKQVVTTARENGNCLPLSTK
jgi:hypothetical protein